MVTTSSVRPAWFPVVASLLLLWNLFGIAMFFLQYTMTPEALARLPEDQRTLFESMPGWLWVVYAVAVLSGALGALMLLLRKRAAVPLFWVSLLAVLVQFGYTLLPGRAVEVLGPAQALPMPLTIIAVAALQVWVARRALARGWIA
jgi:hypothetical protein